MANFKISQLKALQNIDPTASLLVVQNGKNYRISVEQLLNAITPGDQDLENYYTKDEIDTQFLDFEANLEQIIIETVNINTGTPDDANEQFDSIFSI